MNVTPDALAHRLGSGLSPALDADEDLRRLALDLGREILDYGISVLPRELFRGRSGREVAALVAEDVEAAVWMKPLLQPREVTRPAPPSPDGDGEAPQPLVEKIPPRVVEFGRGWGVTAFVLALLNPDQPFEIVDPSRARLWWWRRLTNLHGTKNLRVHLLDHDDFAARNAKGIDLVLTKRMGPADALDFGVPLLRDGGRVLSFQRSDRVAEIRKPRFDADGQPVRLESTLDFESPAARRRQLLCVGVGAAATQRQSAA